jgi:hypothetical protein
LSDSGEVTPIEKHPDAWKTNDSAEVVELRVQGGAVIRCTKDHPIRTKNGWEPAASLKPGDLVEVLDNWDCFNSGGYNNELAELLGHVVTNLKNSHVITFQKDTQRIKAILDKYFQPTYVKSHKLEVFIEGKFMEFLKRTARLTSFGFPLVVNTFTKDQTIAFFRAVFLNIGHAIRNVGTSVIKFTFHDKKFLEYCRVFLNKLGLIGNIEVVQKKYSLNLYCKTNYFRFKELFPDTEMPFITFRSRPIEYTEQDTGAVTKFSKVVYVKDAGVSEVWDVTYKDTGWFFANGIKVANSGKTQSVSMVVAACMILLPKLAEQLPELAPLFGKGFWCGIFAPVLEQASTLFDRVYDILTTDTCREVLTGELHMPIPFKGGSRGNVISLTNGSVCRMHSANLRSRVESKTYHLIIFDEAQDVPEKKANLSIQPMGAATNATTVVTGTPGYVAGLFYNMIEMNKRDDIRRPSSEQCHFEADYTVAQKSNAYYKKSIEHEKKKLGEDSEEFRAAYMLIWPISRGMMFIKDVLVLKCYQKELKLEDSYKESLCVAGVDFGKAQFSTVVTVLKPIWEQADDEGNMPKILLDWLELEGDEWESQYPQIVDFLNNYRVDTLVCDATGLGDPVTERLSVLLPEVTVAPFVFTAPNIDAGYKYLVKEVMGGRLLIPHHSSVTNKQSFKKFELQMTSLTKHYSGRFLMPRSINVDKIPEDFCDSLMMANYGTYYDCMPEVEVSNNSFFERDRVNSDIFGYKYSRNRRG